MVPFVRRFFICSVIFRPRQNFFRREIVDFPSPDERYAIAESASDEFALAGAKIVRAELIEQKTGRVLCDLTR